jgi:hypothetical protein
MASRITARDVDVLNTAATLIAPADPQRRIMLVFNNGPNPIYVGPSGVTTATGFKVPNGEAMPPIYYSVGDQSVGEAWYAIADTADQSGTANTRVLETFAK